MINVGGSGVYSTTHVRLMLLPLLIKMSGPPKMCVSGSAGAKGLMLVLLGCSCVGGGRGGVLRL